MELTGLTAYDEEKYHIQEQHKWTDFPGFSVLCNPHTGQWIALLMRQWDTDSGQELQFCDIRCGEEARREVWSKEWAFPPLRMKGSGWVGIVIDRRTDEQAVRKLLDRAVQLGREQRFTLTLGMPKPKGKDTVGLQPTPKSNP